MKKLILLISIIVVNVSLLFNSCNKPQELSIENKTYAPIYPYFPCYSGSYWIYIDSLGNQSQLQVENEYVEHSFKTSDDSLNEPIFFPKLGDSYYYGYGFLSTSVSLYYPCNESFNTFRKFFLMSGEYKWSNSSCIHHQETFTNENLVYVKKLDSIVVNNRVYEKVIINKSFTTYSGYTSGYPFPAMTHTLRYYAEDVGLILQQLINHPDSLPDTVLVKSLINYKINKNF
jgi:hypothetical protein